ncbi:hypothetical protein ACWCQK_27820 [Streptomyces sp. NPDC002306]
MNEARTQAADRTKTPVGRLLLAYSVCADCGGCDFPGWLTEAELPTPAPCLEGCGGDLEWVVLRDVLL